MDLLVVATEKAKPRTRYPESDPDPEWDELPWQPAGLVHATAMELAGRTACDLPVQNLYSFETMRWPGGNRHGERCAECAVLVATQR